MILHVQTKITYLVMNQTSETYLRETSDGSIRWSTSTFGAISFDNELDAQHHISNLKLRDCKPVRGFEQTVCEVRQ